MGLDDPKVLALISEAQGSLLSYETAEWINLYPLFVQGLDDGLLESASRASSASASIAAASALSSIAASASVHQPPSAPIPPFISLDSPPRDLRRMPPPARPVASLC